MTILSKIAGGIPNVPDLKTSLRCGVANEVIHMVQKAKTSAEDARDIIENVNQSIALLIEETKAGLELSCLKSGSRRTSNQTNTHLLVETRRMPP